MRTDLDRRRAGSIMRPVRERGSGRGKNHSSGADFCHFSEISRQHPDCSRTLPLVLLRRTYAWNDDKARIFQQKDVASFAAHRHHDAQRSAPCA